MVRHLDMFTSATRHQNTAYGLGQPYSSYAASVQPYNNGQNENMANVVGSMDSTFQQNLAWSTVYTVPSGSCSRQSVVYEEWIPPNSPCSQQAPAFTYTPAYALQRNAAGGEQHDYPGPPSLLIQDLASTGQADGQPSPDSILAVSSDGLSGSESPGIPLHLGIPQQGNQALCRPQPARSPFEWMKKSPYQPNPGKTRTKDKYRVVYTDHQRLELEKEFHYSRYITIRRKTELAAMLGLSERQVKIWFQNRRAKERKQAKKREEVLQKGKDPMLQQNAAIAALNLFKPIVHFDQEHHVQMNRIE